MECQSLFLKKKKKERKKRNILSICLLLNLPIFIHVMGLYNLDAGRFHWRHLGTNGLIPFLLQVVPRPNDELPQHRCLIQVNPALCREEQQLVLNEWEPCLCRKYLKPGLVLRWFNLGMPYLSKI